MTERLGDRLALTGLRGMAMVLVVGYHLDVYFANRAWWFFPTGAFGVDVFFVLSGFLITTLLLQQADSSSVRGSCRTVGTPTSPARRERATRRDTAVVGCLPVAG